MKRLLLILVLSGAAFGQETYQQCSDMADAQRAACMKPHQDTYDASVARDLANYQDCINPNSPRSTSLGGCYRSCNPLDYTCLNNCSIDYLGDGTSQNLGLCKNIQLDNDNFAATYQTQQDAPCWADWRMRIDACNAQYLSPIVIDVTGEGFWLTDRAHGVKFRQTALTDLQQMSWTDPAHHNAWLVRPNANGSVTNLALNMFGNLSPQPSSSHANGYAALAWWAEQDGCGKVNQLDAKSCPVVWKQLRLWHDANQDGIAQPGEVVTLEAAGVTSISLQYHESPYIDRYGNQFRYVSKIKDAAAREADRCYDVFLMTQ